MKIRPDEKKRGCWSECRIRKVLAFASSPPNNPITSNRQRNIMTDQNGKILTLTRLTPEEKKTWKKFCQANKVTESGMLRKMIQHVTGGQVPIEFPSLKESKSGKVTIRLRDADHQRLGKKAEEEGFTNRTNWTTAVVLSALYQEPVLNDGEVSTLRESNRELAAVGRNLNQVAHALNLDYSQTEKVKLAFIQAMAERIDLHKARVAELLNMNMNRWRWGDDGDSC